MQIILTKWTRTNYIAGVPLDVTELFSEELSHGWTIQSISTVLDSIPEGRILVVTALLVKESPQA